MSEEKGKFVPISLPSRGLTYQDYKPDAVKIRPFVGEDAELIAELNLSNAKKKLLTIFQNVIKGTDVLKMTSGDIKYAILWEAINSYEREYPLDITCENCTKDITIIADLGKINSKELPENFVQPQDVKLSDRTVKVRLSTLEDEITIMDYASQDRSTYLFTYAICIVDENRNILQRMEMLKTMSPRDLYEIEKFHDKFEHGPDMIIRYVCPKCGKGGQITLPFRLRSLFSFGKKP